MNFCFRCGKELPQDSSFCPYCGYSMEGCPAAEAASPTPKVTGGTRAMSIVSIVLSGEGLGGSIALIFVTLFELFAFLFSMMVGSSDLALIYAFVFCFYNHLILLIMLSYAIPGLILAKKALEKLPDYRPALIGSKLSTVCIIISAAALATSFSMSLLAVLI